MASQERRWRPPLQYSGNYRKLSSSYLRSRAEGLCRERARKPLHGDLGAREVKAGTD